MLDRKTFLRPYAHRGLHGASAGIIENTGPAFEAAIAGGYGIECDLRPARDGLPAVFHDETLERLTESTGPIAALAEMDLGRVQHRTSGAPILTFSGLLRLVDGRVPLLVEIKSEWEPPDFAFLRQIVGAVIDYSGAIALMSFDPEVMAVVRELDPSIPRGIVSGSYRGDGWWNDVLTPERQQQLRTLSDADIVAPHFFAYEVDALPTPETERARASGLPVFTWTVRTEAQRRRAAEHADAIIFEGFKA